jgi:hypothetical protein
VYPERLASTSKPRSEPDFLAHFPEQRFAARFAVVHAPLGKTPAAGFVRALADEQPPIPPEQERGHILTEDPG